ncbi:MAG: FAD-binding protein, partial [Phycisphaerales bacterium]|nr:FAD-binding protein [Phycisphaerales bacterium]
IIHALGDATGKELVATLGRQARQHERIRIFDGCFALDLLTMDRFDPRATPRCLGAITHHPKFGLQVIWARATILATGGCGQVWRESTNPAVATGDGLAMAYRAGAKLADMAFMQFHPTTLYIAGASRSLISEAVRGEGAVLIDRSGHRFMPDYDPRADLAPRDIVSRSVLAQVA